MTAIICVAQPKRGLLHILTDAAMYQQDQTVVAFGTKVWPVSHWPGLVTCAGNAAAVPLFGWALAQQFASWDDLIDDAERGLANLADTVSKWGLGHAAVLLAGISATRGPEAYTFQTMETLPPGVTREEAEASPYYQPPYVLVRLPDTIMTPPVPLETVIAANFEGIDVDAEPDVAVWGMRKHLVMQRAMPLPDGVGGIGGFGELTTISADGVSQRVVDHWPGDAIGAPLHHGPIDWDQWHRQNPRPGKFQIKLVEKKT